MSDDRWTAIWDAYAGDPMDPKNNTEAGLRRVVELLDGTPAPETQTTGYRNENWKTNDAELESALDAFWNVAYTQGHEQRGHDDEAGTAQKADDELRRVIASRAAPSSDKQLEPLKPLLATRFKLSFDGKGRCTTFRKDQAEKLFGEWVWLIEATDGMNSTLYAAPAPETREVGINEK